MQASSVADIPSFQTQSKLVHVQDGRNVSLLHLNSSSHDVFDINTTIFFFHGAMARFDQFAFLIAHYQRYCNVVAYDAYGCGDSEKPYDPLFWGDSHYSMERHASDALKVFQKYATSRNVLIGHSFGTAIVGKIVSMMNTPEHSTTMSGKDIVGLVLLGTFRDCPLTRHPVFFLPVFVLDAIQSVLSAQFAELALSPKCDTSIKAWCAETSSQNKMHVAKSFYSNFGWATADDWLSLAQYPVFIGHGKDDLITPLYGASELFEMLLLAQSKSNCDQLASETDSAALESSLQVTPRVTMEVFEDVGHQIMMEQPQALIRTMSKFLRDCCGLEQVE